MNFNIHLKKRKSLFLSNISVHPSWNNFLSEQVLARIVEIERKILETVSDELNLVTPKNNKVLRFFTIPANEIRVIVLGQDPYPQEGVATGRAFEVATLKSWADTYRNPSLKNIIRAIYKAYCGPVKTYNEIKAEIGQSFLISTSTRVFDNWEEQGVLFLNTAFTCTIGQPNSHLEFWQDFTKDLLRFITEQSPDATWFLWGNNALQATEGISMKKSIFSYHPSRCNPRDKDFLYGKQNCFELTRDQVIWARCKKVEELFNRS